MRKLPDRLYASITTDLRTPDHLPRDIIARELMAKVLHILAEDCVKVTEDEKNGVRMYSMELMVATPAQFLRMVREEAARYYPDRPNMIVNVGVESDASKHVV